MIEKSIVDDILSDDKDVLIMTDELPTEVQTDESMIGDHSNNTTPISSRQRKKALRDVHMDEETGRRTFRDESGRYRYLCLIPTCTNMLRRQADQYCPTHTTDAPKRHSAPPVIDQTSNRYRSPFSTPTKVENESNGNHSEDYETPVVQKTTDLTGTTRSFRDASGKIRFLCLNPACSSRLVRRSDLFCKRHKTDLSVQDTTSIETNKIEQIDVNHNNSETSSQQISMESPVKKRKQEIQLTTTKISNFSIVSTSKMVISTTALLDSQWKDLLTFLRLYPDVQLSTNLNVNDSTTHLLVDDSEHALLCTITKKIVQAAARGQIYIISSRWISDCLRTNSFPAEQSYEIRSDSHTTLRLSTGIHRYLFDESYGFAIECRQCQGSITRNELIELIELTGAKFYEDDNHIDRLIVLCDTNEKNLSKIKDKYSPSNLNNIKYVTSDFLLKSIIKFEIQDIDKYSL